MRKFILIATAAAVVLVAGSLAYSQTANQHSMAVLSPVITEAGQRACVFPIGGWTIIDCSNAAAATSAQLNQFSRYVIQCGDDSYLATGDEATDVADTNDGWLPLGAWLEFMTTDRIRYVSCLNKNVDSDCRIWECK